MQPCYSWSVGSAFLLCVLFCLASVSLWRSVNKHKLRVTILALQFYLAFEAILLNQLQIWKGTRIVCAILPITITVICINNNNINNAVINNYGRLQDFILLFKIPIGTRKGFFEINRQFGHAPSKKFTNPGLGDLGFPPHAVVRTYGSLVCIYL
jgi:hypothetical protein